MVNNEKGLTAIELLGAMALISVAILLFINLSGYMTKSMNQEERKAEALRIAGQELSTLKSSYTSPLPAPGSYPGYTVVYNDSTGLTSAPTYSNLPAGDKYVSLQAIVLASSQPHLITVTVAWGG